MNLDWILCRLKNKNNCFRKIVNKEHRILVFLTEDKMKEIGIREKEEMIVLDRGDVHEEALFDIFTENPNKTVYITEKSDDGHNQLRGIITLGDFRRKQLGNGKLINSQFTKVVMGNENRAIELLKAKKNIISIPIVDSNDNIIREYYKYPEKNEHGEVLFETIKWICTEAMLMKTKYDKCIFIVQNLTKENKKEAEEIFNKTNGEIIITEKITVCEIRRLYTNFSIAVCDFGGDAYQVRKIIYDKLNIDNIQWDLDNIELRKIISDRAKLYENIGIFDKERSFFGNTIDSDIFSLDIEKCVWKEDAQCYEYTGEIEDIESVFMLACFSEHAYMIIGGKYVPIVSLKYLNNPLAECEMACIDIAFNIVPRLQKKNVNCIVINNPNEEYDEIKECLNVDIRNRDRNPWGNKEQLAKFINATEYGDTGIVEELNAVFKPFIKKGFLQVADMKGKYVNFINGERYTCDNPKDFINVMYLFGACIVRGAFVEDQYTMGSYLRKLVDDIYYIKNCGHSLTNMNYVMRNNKYKEGDVAIIFAYNRIPFEANGIKVHSVIDAYKRVPDLQDNVWDNLLHCNKIVMKYIADEVYDICKSQEVLKKSSDIMNEQINYNPIIKFGIDSKEIEVPTQLKKWISSVRKYKVESKGKVGAIVMNCNPFTRGHRYLIEQAKKQVDVLYIFVVEENKSFFDFTDRLKMVKLGVADMDNVIVIPSGKYILSTETLPGYFNKEEQPNVEFDATDDLELFGGVIAKEFGIEVRFAGEEPIDVFTRRYNQFMSNILPEYGVEFFEIPRKQLDGEVISASRVRKCMKEQEYDSVKSLVMPVVYDYLREHYFEKNVS